MLCREYVPSVFASPVFSLNSKLWEMNQGGRSRPLVLPSNCELKPDENPRTKSCPLALEVGWLALSSLPMPRRCGGCLTHCFVPLADPLVGGRPRFLLQVEFKGRPTSLLWTFASPSLACRGKLRAFSCLKMRDWIVDLQISSLSKILCISKAEALQKQGSFHFIVRKL